MPEEQVQLFLKRKEAERRERTLVNKTTVACHYPGCDAIIVKANLWQHFQKVHRVTLSQYRRDQLMAVPAEVDEPDSVDDQVPSPSSNQAEVQIEESQSAEFEPASSIEAKLDHVRIVVFK